jgi:hypothetical protein
LCSPRRLAVFLAGLFGFGDINNTMDDNKTGDAAVVAFSSPTYVLFFSLIALVVVC